MKYKSNRLLIMVLFLLLQVSGFAQLDSDITKEANDLITGKKYESAFKLLQDTDPGNKKPDIVLLKEKIAINYFVSSMMHQMFAFKDLEKNQDLMDYRGKQGTFGMYTFAINDVLDTLIKQFPDNYSLYKGLAEFYYDAQQRYGDKWLKDDSIVSDLIVKNYQIVIDHNLVDDKAYYVLGLEKLTHNKKRESIPYFLKAIELKKDIADAHYNVAYAYLFEKDLKNALKYALNSLELYKDVDNKGDAARMVAEIYADLKDEKNALKYYELANTIAGSNYYNLRPLLHIYVRNGSPKASATLDAFYKLGPDKPAIYQDLMDIYSASKKIPVLIDFLKSKFATYRDQKEVMGSLNFYLGVLYLPTDKKTAKAYFLKSKEVFSEVLEKDNKVFNAIEEGIQEAEK
jgi:tetratricopeptide (TPR) repeat protein